MPATRQQAREEYHKHHRMAADAMDAGDHEACDQHMRMAYAAMKRCRYNAVNHDDDAPRVEDEFAPTPTGPAMLASKQLMARNAAGDELPFDARNDLGEMPDDLTIKRQMMSQGRRYSNPGTKTRTGEVSRAVRAAAATNLAQRRGISFKEALKLV